MLGKNRKTNFLTAIIILIFFTAVILPFLRKNLIDGMYFPFKIISYINREIKGVVFYHQNLVKVQHLEKQAGLFRRQIHEIEELYLENIRLRQLLDFKEKTVYPLTAARVIAFNPSNLTAIITLDKGVKQGVKQGCTVITNDGLVGRVVEAGGVTSKVLLINDMDSGVAAIIQRSRQKGLVLGTLSSGLVLRYLPPDADIQISDLVVTSGLSGIYPEGILIGKVTGIREEPGRPELIADIEPGVNLNMLEEVLVVLVPSEESGRQ